MILVVLMVMVFLITIFSVGRPMPSRGGTADNRSQNRRFGAAEDDVIGSVRLQYSWTELDEYQLRRLLDS
jgi:hypothetical protein